jgi:hypothetical protein
MANFISPANNPSHGITVHEKKAAVVEDVETLKPAAKVDYSGAAEKSDPKEISLVKKLDRWIMPMLWSVSYSSSFISA